MTAAPVSRPVSRPAPSRPAPAGRRPAPVALVALVFVVGVLSLYGAELAVGVLRAGGGAPPVPAVGVPLGTSFGTVTVEHAQTIDGLTARDMWNGMTHGIQDLVAPGEAQVAVALYLVNEGDRAVPVDAGQFRLVLDGTGEPAVPTGTTVLPLRLEPGSGVRGTLVFVVPLGEARASVVYLDPAGPPVTVPVGTLHEPPAPAPGHTEATGHDE